MLLCVMAAPALACLLPGRALTPQEHACCKRMARQCGSMRMSSSHSCCQIEVRAQTSLVKTSAPSVNPQLHAIASYQAASESPNAYNADPLNPIHPPPRSSPSSTILRI